VKWLYLSSGRRILNRPDIHPAGFTGMQKFLDFILSFSAILLLLAFGACGQAEYKGPVPVNHSGLRLIEFYSPM
jgi:hypothetical protein